MTVNCLFCAMHVRPSILFTLRLRCFLTFSGGYRKPMRTCSRKWIIVHRKYVMFIKQSPTRFTMVTKNDTKTGHFLIYIFRHIIQNCFLISYYNNIAVIIIIINNNNNTTIGNQQLQFPVKAWSPPKYALLFDDDRACAQGRSGKTSYQRYHTCVISLIRCFATTMFCHCGSVTL